MNSILRLPEVMKATGLSRSSVYAYIKENKFPSPRKLSERSVGWLLSDVNAWIESRIPTKQQAN